MKYFRMSYEEVVFRRSYINIILLNRSIPSYKWDDEKDEENKVKKIGDFAHENSLFESLM